MADNRTSHSEQIEFWNGIGGERWVKEYKRTDKMLEPVTSLLLTRANLREGNIVVDVGCGGGSTTKVFRERVGDAGKLIGIDVSAPLLQLARERLSHYPDVELIHADASTYYFSEAIADLVVSRFGVMFFGEPVSAFANLRTVLAREGHLLFACWRSFEENLWAKIPLDAVSDLIPPSAPSDPDEPGPFAFASRERISRILTEAGFLSIEITPVDTGFSYSPNNSLEDAVQGAVLIGPTSRALREQPDSVIDTAKISIYEALAAYQTERGVILPGAIWLVEASNG